MTERLRGALETWDMELTEGGDDPHWGSPQGSRRSQLRYSMRVAMEVRVRVRVRVKGVEDLN